MTIHSITDLLDKADELERLACEEIIKRRRFGNAVSGLVTPAGEGRLAIAMARLECRVTVLDAPGAENALRGRALAAGLTDEIRLAPGGFESLPSVLPGEAFDLAVVRHGLCTVPHDQARAFLGALAARLKIGGKLYVSIFGLHSELGDNYPGNEQMPETRFCKLAPPMAAKYDIYHPVCLYSERDLFTLLMAAGLNVLRTFTTTHGNVKGIAVRV